MPTPSPKELADFRASLAPKDIIIHDLAIKMLKSRYTPERTNAWIRWKRASASAAAAAP
jgi:hypothetical protein